MKTNAPQISRRGRRHLIVLVSLLLILAAGVVPSATVTTEVFGTAAARRVTAFTITYTAYNGTTRHAEVLLPSWYSSRRNPPLPLVISPHGRGGTGAGNAGYWGTLPTTGGFAVVNPDGMGRRNTNCSFGYRGQIDDLARMPELVTRSLPWVRIDRQRIFALGSSMGGQETLLLVARHPELLAGAAAMDSVTNLVRRYGQLSISDVSAQLESTMRTEVGGAPTERPRAYAARSPLSQARAIARSGVPLQIWWSSKDRIVVDQKHQSGELFRRLRQLGPEAHLKAYVGRWRHSSEMRSTSMLPLAPIDFGLLPHGFAERPATVQIVHSTPVAV